MVVGYHRLRESDADVAHIMKGELLRQENTINLIASENYTSVAVMEAQGSLFTNKYAEGYPGRRYYQGCAQADQIESLAIERAKRLFNVKYANVQPHSGSQANQAVFLGLLQPGDTILSLSLDAGGHLTHGSQVNQSGKFYNVVSYNVDSSGVIDYKDLHDKAIKHKPRLIITGFSAYSRSIDFRAFRKAADDAGAYLMVDMAHFAGMVAAGLCPDVVEDADIITSTTHKTLRGPRGGMILTNDEEIAKKVNRAVFPGIQGGQQIHSIAAKAVAFKEAMSLEYKQYISNVLENAKVMSSTLMNRGYTIVGNGTDNHLFMMDYSKVDNINGHDLSIALEECGMVCNKNMVPNDPGTPQLPSGIRVGTPAMTTRGFSVEDVIKVAHMIADISDYMRKGEGFETEEWQRVKNNIKAQVRLLCNSHPVYPELWQSHSFDKEVG